MRLLRHIARGLYCLVIASVFACGTDPDTRPLRSLAPLNCPPSAPAATPLRLLTRAEYDNTVRDLLGDRTQPATRGFPREPLADGFDNDATSNRVTSDHVVRFLQASETLAYRAVEQRKSEVIGCDPASPSCREQFIRAFGRRAYRRTLTDPEIATMLGVWAAGLGAGGEDEAARWTIQAFLQSPQFLYRDERLPDTSGELDGFRLATRLSYTVWATMPDDALLDAAERGDLSDPQLRAGEIKRLLSDPRALEGKMRYFSLWLGIDGIETLRKDAVSFPSFQAELATDWRASIELFLRDVVARGNDLRTLLTLRSVYLTSRMGFYATGTALQEEPSRVERSEYAGLLTQPGFLAKLAAPDQSSPIRRGVFVLDKLMCQPPPPPPANANLVPPEPTTATTTRERFASHASGGCASCHARIDGVGFLFEGYDGMGVHRTMENGRPVDTSGIIDSPRDKGIAGPLDGVATLSRKLATSGQVSDCLAHEWLRFALGRSLVDGDACSLYDIQRRFAEANGSFDALLAAIVESEAFRSHAGAEVSE